MNLTLALLPLALLVLGLPIYLILITTCAVVVLLFERVPLDVLPALLFGSVNKPVLIALPFFILAGEIMAHGGIATRIVDFVMSLIGGVRGSLGLTAVGSSTMFGAVSGSSPATVAAIGRLLYRPLREHGYNDPFASSLLTSCGGLAIVIPPSTTMILYGAAAQQSVPHLFIAGIIPGLLIALLIGIYVYVYARSQNIQHGRVFQWANVASATRKSALALFAPLIILGGIYLGVFTPTEAGGVACAYAAYVACVVYREVSLRDLWLLCVRSMYLTAQIFIVIAAASVYSWLLTIGGVPAAVTSVIQQVSDSPWTTLMLINIFLLIVGCFIDPASAIIVLTPLLVPIAQQANVDLIHLGIIIVVNLEIGMFTPPFGLNIFVAQSIFHTPLRVLYPGLVPFIALNIVALMFITHIPELSLFLTRYL
jgi:C4-dicarboxylate transporter DctM subunit